MKLMQADILTRGGLPKCAKRTKQIRQLCACRQLGAGPVTRGYRAEDQGDLQI
jgi:hypothetical protein